MNFNGNILENKSAKRGEENLKKVDLSKLTFNFLGKDDLDKYFDELESIGFDEWYEDKKEKFETLKDFIEEMVEKGVIADGEPRTIFEYERKQLLESRKNVYPTKEKIEENLDFILRSVQDKLEKYIESWSPDNITVNIAVQEDADFRYDRGVVTVDILRLSKDKDFVNTLVMGLAHELIHAWLDNKKENISEEEKTSRRIVDEGLAVFVSGQSLKDHHEKNLGRNYDEYKKYSLETLNEFLVNPSLFLEKNGTEGFKNMGHFYVSAYELVKKLHQQGGDEAVKEFMKKVKIENSQEVLKELVEKTDNS